ncbi:MAG TPA: ACT domain-containing protein [Acidocella sp.]|jgi:glycine cleavage system regulatory protein|nr:ACT domain-containing protein [Acidocella sp.]
MTRAGESIAVLTCIGQDRPGLVNAIAEQISAAGGNWLESRLEHLAGQFAGIVQVRVPEGRIPALTAALQSLQGLSVTLAQGVDEPEPALIPLTLAVLGHDRPGIVRDVTQALTKLGVNIEEFSSAIESAPFTGEEMFRATLKLGLPEHVSSDEVRRILEKLADEIMVDIKAEETV